MTKCGDGGVERVVARHRTVAQVAGRDPGKRSSRSIGALPDVRLHDRARARTGIDLDGERRASRRRTARSRSPRLRSRASTGQPRIEPVPTLPLPPTWNVDFGRTPPYERDRRLGDPQVRGELGSRPAGRVPRTEGCTSESQSSPSRAAAAHSSSTVAKPARCEEPRRQREREVEAHDEVVVGRGERERRDRPLGHGCGRPRVGRARRRRASASQIARRSPLLRPDQSTATTRTQLRRRPDQHLAPLRVRR